MSRIVTSLAAALALVALASTAQADPYYRGYGPGPGPGPSYYYPPPPPAPAQVGHRYAWWYAGAGVVGTSILDQSGGPEPLHGGGGLSAWLGVNLSRTLSLELGWLGSLHNPVTYDTGFGHDTSYLFLEGVTADAKIHLARGPIDPYLQGGVGVYFMGDSSTGYADSVGPGYQLGGGVDFWVGPFVTLGARALFRGIEMGPRDGGPADTFLHAATVEGSVALHF